MHFEGGDVRKPKMGLEGEPMDSKMKGSRNLRKDMIFRADKIDLKSLDASLEKHLNRVLSRSLEAQKPKEKWEIDLAKLDLRNVVANEAYVKVLDWGEDGVATTAAIRVSFRQEVTVWHKLNHPNITKFVGASMGTSNLKFPLQVDGQHSFPSRACCIVVEFLAGGTLKQYLIKIRGKKLPYKVVVQLALDLARGLNYLHSKKIVHRDVKTDNLWLDADLSLKIADFGVARVEALNPIEMTGETGTLGYMAPEMEGLMTKDVMSTTSAFACGKFIAVICLIQLKVLPLCHLQLLIIKNLRPEIPRCCPSALANIMRKCWDAKPFKRPEMHEVVKMLEALDTRKGGGMIPLDQTPFCFCFAPRGP